MTNEVSAVAHQRRDVVGVMQIVFARSLRTSPVTAAIDGEELEAFVSERIHKNLVAQDRDRNITSRHG